MHWLEENLRKSFELPESAISWLLMIYSISQFFDDVADGDTVSRSDLDSALWNSLIGINQNQFFLNHSNILIPLVATAILKWQGSDIAEREGDADEKSFVWRAGFYDLVLMSVNLCHGPSVAAALAPRVMGLYGEKYEEYKKEFDHA